MDRRMAQLSAQLDCPIAAVEILGIVPAAYQFFIATLVAPGQVGEEASRLAGPGEVRHLPVDQPLFEVRSRGGDTAGPDWIKHFGQSEIVAQRLRLGFASSLSIGDGLVHALLGPV